MILDALNNMNFRTPSQESISFSDVAEDVSDYTMDMKEDLESLNYSSDDGSDDNDDPFQVNCSETTGTFFQNYKLAPPSYNTKKCTYQDCTTDTPTSSPTKKKSRPQVLSSIRKALEKKGEPRGVLQYFRKVTEAEHQAYLKKSTAELMERADDEQWKIEKRKKTLQEEKRQCARERKQRQHDRKKRTEISCGLHSPGGTKIRVNFFTSTEVTT
jgi:hypothetical protein